MSMQFEGKALILHRPHATADSLVRQLTQLGIAAVPAWPELAADVDPADFGVLFFDADMGHDGQFRWEAGLAPMPTIALIGSEAPGRVAWAIRRGADAHLLKPIPGGGVFSALLIARDAFARRLQLRAEITSLRQRLELREVLAEATALLMTSQNLGAADAYRALRRRAMDERLSIEDMAAQIVAQTGLARRHDRA